MLIFSLIIVFVYFVDIKRSLLTGYPLYELHFFFNILFILRVPPIFIGEYFIRFHTVKTEKRERLSTSNSRWSTWDNYGLSPPESQPKYFRKLIVYLLASCPFLWNKNQSIRFSQRYSAHTSHNYQTRVPIMLK